MTLLTLQPNVTGPFLGSEACEVPGCHRVTHNEHFVERALSGAERNVCGYCAHGEDGHH